jgi:prepilin-type N-terminal cleavage/methylation domain-containing protein
MAETIQKRQVFTKRWSTRHAQIVASRHSFIKDGGRAGLSLIELLLTLAVLGILVAVLIPQLSGDLPERLSAAAQVISSDLDYARSLAVSNNTSYRLTFNTAQNEYVLAHCGANPQFNTLPRSPFRQTGDAANEQTTELSELPIPEPRVRLVAVVRMQGGGQSVANIEFTPLGGTTSGNPTVLWLACGRGSLRRFLSISVDPVTGLATIGQPVTALPLAINTIVQQAEAVEAGN